AAVVVTGQQVGLFGGPTFAIYKAMTTVKLAEEATAAGVDSVPVFWLATYDHDLAEVNHVTIPGADGSLTVLETPSHDVPGSSVLVFTLHNGARAPIQRRLNGDNAEFIVDHEAGAEKLSQADLLSRMQEHPELFSPNVLLRPVVQDYLLPTLAYTGGAAEAAY